MNTKEVNELRRRWRPDHCAVTHIYGCYVSPSRQIVSDLAQPLSMMNEDEKERYLGFLKKTLSGKMGKNLVDIVFSTRQVADSDEHRLLMGLRDSGLKDLELRRAFYDRVIESLDMDGTGYLLLLAHDTYDVPRKGKDDSVLADASDEVFSYFLCCVCPVKDTRPALSYDPGDNEFHFMAGQTVGAPELGFLFPCFDDRAANIYNALYYARKPSDLHQEFIDAVFHVEPPMSAQEQKEAFEAVLQESLEEDLDLTAVQSVYDWLCAKITEHKEAKIADPLTVTVRDLAALLGDCQVPEERVQAFQEKCGEKFGTGAVLTPANLIDPGHFVVRTKDASISLDPASSFAVEVKVIDGRPCLVIPASAGVEVNGLPVRLKMGE